MKLGFTMDEKVFNKISYSEIIEKTKLSNTSSIELSPDLDVLSLDVYKGIVSTASSNNMDINYHIPYFANEIYDLKFFSEYESKLKEKYISFLNLLMELQDTVVNSPVIVLHGADYEDSKKSTAFDDTLKFIDWMMNIVCSKNLNFTLAIETLRKKTLRNVFDNRDDLFSILEKFDSDKLKICWDMCHDKLNYYPNATKVDSEFLEKVAYCHIHGHNLVSNTSHISLLRSDINFSDEINALNQFGFNGSVNIELLSNFCEETYIADLFNDLDYMSKL